MIPTNELDDYPKRTSSRRKLLLGVVGGALIAGVAVGVLARAPVDETAGDQAPDFSLALLGDEGTLSSDDLRGRPVVLNFWASWCVPCREEMPLFESRWRAHRDEGLQFVGVLVRDTPESALAFLERHDITYPIVWDEDQELANALGVAGLPQTFFIARDWRMIEGVVSELSGGGGTRAFGAISADELEERIEELLGR